MMVYVPNCFYLQAYDEVMKQKKEKHNVRRLFATEFAKNRNVTVSLSKLQEDLHV